jgi:cellulose synthase/poly-beta-1,6-N-acetylglucosamine synthase-like glycosyltransferase
MYEYKILIPTYNGESRISDTLVNNIEYADKIMVIDDGSIDRTSEKVERFIEEFQTDTELLRLEKNKRKVGAIKEGLSHLPEDVDYVVLLDDDSVISSPKEKMQEACKYLEENDLAAASFKLYPKNKGSFLEKLQNLEYSISNAMRKALSRKQRCIPGTAGIYKREPLEEALDHHSFDWDGEDMETTWLLQELGYDVGHFPEVDIETEVPNTLKEKIQQKRRWERGAIRTYARR